MGGLGVPGGLGPHHPAVGPMGRVTRFSGILENLNTKHGHSLPTGAYLKTGQMNRFLMGRESVVSSLSKMECKRIEVG